MSKRQREALRLLREHRRRQAVAAIGAVLFAFCALIGGRLVLGPSRPQQAVADDAAVTSQVVERLFRVPDEVLNAVGKGDVATLPRPLTGQAALASDGKPLVVYLGADYCPFCAAQRWGLVVALARFGTFTGLTLTASSDDDVYPGTPTVTFHGASYRSDYLVFEGVELADREGSALDKATPAQQQLLRSHGSNGAIPFLDLGNRYVITGSSFSPELLTGHSADQISAALTHPDDAMTRAILGSANAYTTIICGLTAGKPVAVCTGPAALAFQGDFRVS